MTLAAIQIADIEVGTRLRAISAAQVEALVASIGDVGLLNPITVFETPVFRSGISSDGYGLVAGAHRLEACKRLGLVDIAAQIVDLKELERQIAECDENLCSTSLSKAERALFTSRRKDAYEALHPETKYEARPGRAGKSRQVGDNSEPADRFTADTAAKTGKSERSIQRDAERGSSISEKALAALIHTKLDNGAYLDALKAIPAKDQASQVAADLAAAKPKKPVTALSDQEIKEKQVAALMSAWNKASAEARQEFLDRIDTPIMDGRFK